jgi:hypothetical protein
MHESLDLSDKQIKRRLELLGIRRHRRSDANYYVCRPSALVGQNELIA